MIYVILNMFQNLKIRITSYTVKDSELSTMVTSLKWQNRFYKKYGIIRCIFIILAFVLSVNSTFAAASSLFGDGCVEDKKITWNTFPKCITGAIDFWMSIVWAVCILFIVVWAYRILFWWVVWDKAKWKQTIISALVWFALACSAWLIVSLLIQNLT